MVFRRDEQVVLLNQDLMGEHQAIVHYLTHAWTVVRQYGDAIEAIARDEMRHFKWLAHAIVALGGVPDLTPPDLLPAFTGAEALDYDIDAEEEAISQYLAHQRDIADDRVQSLIGRIVVDERFHRRQFMALRASWQEVDRDETASGEADPKLGQKFQRMISGEYQEILRSLMESFLMRHAREVGLDAEDRAVDEMKHLSWMAESMADAGGTPRFSLPTTPGSLDEAELYRGLRAWAEAEMVRMVPLIDRIVEHEQYHQDIALSSRWTVGSGTEGGWAK